MKLPNLQFTKKQQELYNLAKADAKEYHNHGLFTKLDMHIHSNMSDGLFSIPQLITMAKEFGLECIFITDHGTCLPGYNLLKSLPKEFIGNLDVNIGCEIATKIEDPVTKKFIPIEILSYFADPYKIQAFLDKYNFANNTSQEEQLKILQYTCDKLGLIYSDNLTVPKGCYSTEVLCRDLIKYEKNKSFFLERAPIVWDSPKLFYKMFVANPDSDFYIDTTAGLPYYKDTINAINNSGGYAIVAHPFLYSRHTEEEVKQLMDKIVDTSDISGFEAIHSSHTNKQRKFIINYTKQKGLYYTGGSDFHCGSKTILGYGQKSCPILLTLDKCYLKNKFE